MDLLNIFFSSIGSIIVLFLLTKLIGNKQVSELSTFDYINGITIGSIAAEMATSLEGDFLKPLLAMIIYAGAVILISFISSKYIGLRRFLIGRSIILLENNKLYKENLKKARLDMTEFLTQCRTNGYFDLSQVESAVFEPSGRISFLPKAQYRPVQPQDLSIPVSAEKPCVIVVSDGQILEKNLHTTGNDNIWLQKQLKEQGVNSVADVFLASCDSNNKLTVYIKLKNAPQNDIFG